MTATTATSPAVKTGDQLTTGDTFKDRGKWHTATGPSWIPDIGGRPWPAAREIPVGDDPGDGYGRPTVLVFTDQVYPLKGAKGTPLTVTTWPRGGQAVPVTTLVTYQRGEDGERWNIRLAANGRLLGWAWPERSYGEGRDWRKVTGWSAHVASDAFRGAGPDDEGHVMDDVPGYLYGGGSGRSDAIATGCRTRDDAAEEILRRLHDKAAPALGYGRHYAVKVYDDPTCAGYRQRWAATDAGPVCPGCGATPAALYVKRPHRRGDRYQGTVGYHLAREGRRTS